jgi:hypothetical protein
MYILSSTQEAPENQLTLLSRVLIFSHFRISPDVSSAVECGIAVIGRVSINVTFRKVVASSEKDLDPLERVPIKKPMKDLMLQNRPSTTISLFQIDEKLILMDEVSEGIHRTGI